VRGMFHFGSQNHELNSMSTTCDCGNTARRCWNQEMHSDYLMSEWRVSNEQRKGKQDETGLVIW